MLGFSQRNKGAISVFLVLILLPTYIFTTLIIDGTIIYGGKNIINDAADLSMRGALAHYDKSLLASYGFFAMDSETDVVGDTAGYFYNTLDSSSAENFLDQPVGGTTFIKTTPDKSATTVELVEYSQIYRPYVMESQMLQYMKYRAPIVLIKDGLFDKFPNFSGVKEAKECANAQREYEYKLAKIQDHMNKLNMELNEYHNSGMREKYKTGDNWIAWVDEMKSSLRYQTKLNIAYYSVYEDVEGTDMDIEDAAELAVEAADDISLNEHNILSNVKKIRTAKKYINTVGNTKLTSLVDKDEDPDKYKELKELQQKFDVAKEKVKSAVDLNRSTMYANSQALETEVQSWNDICNEEWNYLNNLDADCKAVLNALNKAQGARKTWKSKIEKMPDGDSKNGFKQNYNEDSALFDKFAEDTGGSGGENASSEQVSQGAQELYDKIVEDKKFVSDVRIYLNENVRFLGYGIFAANSYLSEDNKRSKQYICEDEAAVDEAADNIMYEFDNNYYDCNLENRSLNDLYGTRFASEMRNNYCKPKVVDSEKDKENKSKFSSLQNLGKSEKVQDNITNTRLSQSIESMTLPSNKESVASVAAPEPDNTSRDKLGEVDDPSKDSNRDKIKEAGDGMMKDTDDTLENMKQFTGTSKGLLRNVYETAYESTYIMNMFSYRTSGLGEGDKKDKAKSLTNLDLTKDYLYQGEAEYILWGDKNVPKDNITRNETSIFAIRFTLNAITAFTDGELQSQAHTMASGLSAVFPLAEPFVATTILLAWTLAETTYDQVQLCNKGGDIPIFKNYTTWHYKFPLPSASSKDTYDKKVATMNYRDYTWLFLTLNMLSSNKREQCLLRTADCIELNMTSGDRPLGHSILDEYTMVSMESEVSINTYFLKNIANYLDTNSPTNSVEYDPDKFTLKYYGALGY